MKEVIEEAKTELVMSMFKLDLKTRIHVMLGSYVKWLVPQLSVAFYSMLLDAPQNFKSSLNSIANCYF